MSAGARRGPLWRPVLVATLAAVATAAAGGLLTDVGPWYQALRNPDWKPPDWLFGPAWTTIFFLCVVSGVTAWRRAPGAAERRLTVGLFALNYGLNVGWSLLFFHLRRPDWALWEVGFLWGSVAALVLALARWSKLSAWLLLPYLSWVGFASALNAAIVRLNAPFG